MRAIFSTYCHVQYYSEQAQTLCPVNSVTLSHLQSVDVPRVTSMRTTSIHLPMLFVHPAVIHSVCPIYLQLCTLDTVQVEYYIIICSSQHPEMSGTLTFVYP